MANTTICAFNASPTSRGQAIHEVGVRDWAAGRNVASLLCSLPAILPAAAAYDDEIRAIAALAQSSVSENIVAAFTQAMRLPRELEHANLVDEVCLVLQQAYLPFIAHTIKSLVQHLYLPAISAICLAEDAAASVRAIPVSDPDRICARANANESVYCSRAAVQAAAYAQTAASIAEDSVQAAVVSAGCNFGRNLPPATAAALASLLPSTLQSALHTPLRCARRARFLALDAVQMHKQAVSALAAANAGVIPPAQYHPAAHAPDKSRRNGRHCHSQGSPQPLSSRRRRRSHRGNLFGYGMHQNPQAPSVFASTPMPHSSAPTSASSQPGRQRSSHVAQRSVPDTPTRSRAGDTPRSRASVPSLRRSRTASRQYAATRPSWRRLHLQRVSKRTVSLRAHQRRANTRRSEIATGLAALLAALLIAAADPALLDIGATTITAAAISPVVHCVIFAVTFVVTAYALHHSLSPAAPLPPVHLPLPATVSGGRHRRRFLAQERRRYQKRAAHHSQVCRRSTAGQLLALAQAATFEDQVLRAQHAALLYQTRLAQADRNRCIRAAGTPLIRVSLFVAAIIFITAIILPLMLVNILAAAVQRVLSYPVFLLHVIVVEFILPFLLIATVLLPLVLLNVAAAATRALLASALTLFHAIASDFLVPISVARELWLMIHDVGTGAFCICVNVSRHEVTFGLQVVHTPDNALDQRLCRLTEYGDALDRRFRRPRPAPPPPQRRGNIQQS